MSARVSNPRKNQNDGSAECKRGHEFTDENTYVDPKLGHRQCRACRRARKTRYAAERMTRTDNRPRWVRELGEVGPDETISVPLNSGKEGHALIDAADLGLVASSSWQLCNGYARTGGRDGGRRIVVYMHRLLLGLNDERRVDHIDRDRLNNRRPNLRIASASENNRNTGLRCDNSSGFKGVSPSRSGWYACIAIDGKSINLGCFSTPEMAAEAYDLEAARSFGEFAQTNSSMGLL